MKAACFAGSSLREIVVGLRCSIPSRCNKAIRPDRPSYSMPHSRAIHAPISRLLRVAASALPAAPRPGCPPPQPPPLPRRQPASTSFVAETRQALDTILLIHPVPGPDRVVVQVQYPRHRLTAHAVV